MNKLINGTADVVRETLRGSDPAHGDRVRENHELKVVYRKDTSPQTTLVLRSAGGTMTPPSNAIIGSGAMFASRGRRAPALGNTSARGHAGRDHRRGQHCRRPANAEDE